nr:MAG TPA: hypothetical protein [Bacteriophage sp.]
MGFIILTLLGLKYLPGWVKLVWLFHLPNSKVRKEPKRCPAQSVRSAGQRPRRLVNLPICLTRWVTTRLPMP